MGNATSKFLSAEEVLAPILSRARSLCRYDGMEGLLEGVSVKAVQEAVASLREASELECRPASVMLGECFYRGIGVERDDGVAKSFFDQAASEGNAEAQFFLARMYYYGDAGLLRNYDKAFELFQESAAHGSILAQNSLGAMYIDGHGVEKDEVKAVEWFRKAAERGNAAAQDNLGAKYANGHGVEKDEVKAVEWYRKATEQGYAWAQNHLGYMYTNGRGVEKDEATAVEWYRKAAEQGYANAQFNLGVMYDNGHGVEKDEAKAVKWYRKAAEQGNANAQTNLGWMYDNGRGVEKDEVKAVEWYRKAAEQGRADAQNYLGWMYEYGHEVEKDEVKAVEWYRKAAEQGDAGAQNNLGRMYDNGSGVEKDDVTAVEWYRKAAEQGDSDAQYNLGVMYNNGRGVEKDEVKAVEWYRKAAEQGHAWAQYSLGFMYNNGRGIEKDEAKAVEWYRKAAEQGNSAALTNLGLMYENGTGVVKNPDRALILYSDAARKGNDTANKNLARLEGSLDQTVGHAKQFSEETDEAVSMRAKAVLAADRNGAASAECKPLMDVCTPSLYLRNSFRIVGLYVDALQRDIRRRTEDLSAVEETPDWAREHRHSLPLPRPPTPEDVRNALLRLQDPECRLIDEFFWFWPLGSAECKKDRALQHFLSGECDQAYSIWHDAANASAVDSIPAIHNLAVYHHLLAIEGEWIEDGSQGSLLPVSAHVQEASQNWIEALRHWERLVDDELFWKKLKERVCTIDDARLSVKTVEAMRSVFPVAFDKINAVFASKYAEAGRVVDARRHLQYMSQSHQGLDDVEQTLSTIVQPSENRVKMLVKNAMDAIRLNPASGLASAKELLKGVRPYLDVVNGLLESRHSIREGLSDSVALAVFSCLIAYGNKTEDWKPCIAVLSEVETLASTEDTKKKIRENREIAQNNFREKELRETCWFCKKSRACSGVEYVVSMHGDVQRDYYGGKVTWKTLDVKVPRCRACQTAHIERANWTPGKSGSESGFVIGAIIWVIGISVFSGGAAFLIAAITFFAGGAIGSAIGSTADETETNRPALPKGISYEADAVNYPDVKKMREIGLDLGGKPHGVN